MSRTFRFDIEHKFYKKSDNKSCTFRKNKIEKNKYKWSDSNGKDIYNCGNSEVS